MYAIVEIGGHQYRVSAGKEIFVNRLHNDEGAQVSFDRVMLTETDGAVRLGKPTLNGVLVSATVLQHLKGDKVIVFKKKRRKGYKVKRGHRDYLTKIRIDAIA